MSRKPYQLGLSALFVSVLCACGGGGGGSGNGAASQPTTAQRMQLSFTPGSVDATVYQGESKTLSVAAQASGNLPVAGTVVNIGIVDKVGVLEPGFQNTSITKTSETQYSASFKISKGLMIGQYTGSIEVRACQDDPSVCAKPIPGSPWLLPYRFEVKSQLNAGPLTGLADTSNYFAGADHNALSSTVLDFAKVSRRWSHSNDDGYDLQPAVGSGQVFAARTTANQLLAYSERDGFRTWRQVLDGEYPLSAPALVGSRVFVVTRPSPAPGATALNLRSFDANSGQPLGQVALGASGADIPGMVARDGKLYLCQDSGSLSRYDATSLRLEWTVSLPSSPGLDRGCLPAIDERNAYVYRRAGLQVIDLASGRLAFSIASPANTLVPTAQRQAPVLGANGRVYLSLWSDFLESEQTRLLAFDTVQRKLAWSIAGNFTSNAVVRADALYVTRGSQFEVRSPETGQVLWAWDRKDRNLGEVDSALLVIGKHAFISNRWETWAIDTSTRQPVWQEDSGGQLVAAPSGVLYLWRSFGQGLRTFNLN